MLDGSILLPAKGPAPFDNSSGTKEEEAAACIQQETTKFFRPLDTKVPSGCGIYAERSLYRSSESRSYNYEGDFLFRMMYICLGSSLQHNTPGWVQGSLGLLVWYPRAGTGNAPQGQKWPLSNVRIRPVSRITGVPDSGYQCHSCMQAPVPCHLPGTSGSSRGRR